MNNNTSYNQRVWKGRQVSVFSLEITSLGALHDKFYVIAGQNVHDQITRLIEGPNVHDRVLCISFILNGSPNDCWLHTCQACTIAIWK